MEELKIHPYIFMGLSTTRKILLLNGSAVDTGELNIILKTVCDHCGITPADFMSKGRSRPLTNARFIFTGIVYTYFNYTCVYVGKFMNRHHSAIIYYKKNCRSIASVDKKFNRLFEEALKESSINLDYHGFKHRVLRNAFERA